MFRVLAKIKIMQDRNKTLLDEKRLKPWFFALLIRLIKVTIAFR